MTPSQKTGLALLAILLIIMGGYLYFNWSDLTTEELAGISSGVFMGWLAGYFLTRKGANLSAAALGSVVSITLGGAGNYFLPGSSLAYYLINILYGLFIQRALAIIAGRDIIDTIAARNN